MIDYEKLTDKELHALLKDRLTDAQWRLSTSGITEYGLREVAQNLYELAREIDRRTNEAT